MLLTAASWGSAAPARSGLEEQRSELIRTLNDASDLTVEVRIGAAPVVRVKDAARLLVETGKGVAGRQRIVTNRNFLLY